MRNTKSHYSSHALLLIVAIFGFVNGTSVEKDLSLSQRQKQALDKFREQVKPLLYKDYMKNDIYLIRWLRAKNFNVNDAEAMLKENIRWRQENKIDTIQSEDFKDMFQDFPTTVDTYDKQGRPIGVIDIYLWDIRQAVISGRGARLLRYMDMLMDNVTLQVFEQQQKGLSVTQWKVLGNADGFNMANHGCPICMPLWIQFIRSLENHFHGWMDEFIVIEASSSIHTIINVLSPFLSRHTRDGLKVFGANKKEWMQYMDQRISQEERRQAYGGTKPPVERD